MLLRLLELAQSRHKVGCGDLTMYIKVPRAHFLQPLNSKPRENHPSPVPFSMALDVLRHLYISYITIEVHSVLQKAGV